tara:strand:- start:806 stop:1540 length:735 start_codon:yes stop_codon:yes gene_type:complete
MIPKTIYQTHKSMAYVMDNDRLFDCYQSWDVKGYTHNFFSDKKADDFMKENFPDIYEIYHNLPVSVMKADLWRYCVIYHYGGIYADMDTIFIGNDLDSLFQKETNLILTPEYPHDVNLCQWVFGAPKGSPLLKSVIDESIKRIKNCDDFKYEHMVHTLTGPSVFTDGIENYLKENNFVTFFGEDRKKYVTEYKNEVMHVHDSHLLYDNHIEHVYSGQWEGGWITDVNEFTGIEHIKITLDKEGR